MNRISRIQYITNGQTVEAILNEARDFVLAGGDWLQLRIKNTTLDRLAIAREVKEICAGRAIFIVNDDVEVAKAVDADGVHLGLTDMAIAEARAILGEHKIIGGTANTSDDCLERQNSGADYIGLGPYKMTITKEKLSPVLGLEGYQKIVGLTTEITIPVVGIGGIELDDIAPLMQHTGLHGIAVSGLIARAANKIEQLKAIEKEILTLKSL